MRASAALSWGRVQARHCCSSASRCLKCGGGRSGAYDVLHGPARVERAAHAVQPQEMALQGGDDGLRVLAGGNAAVAFASAAAPRPDAAAITIRSSASSAASPTAASTSLSSIVLLPCA